jgi:hypothetical protein
MGRNRYTFGPRLLNRFPVWLDKGVQYDRQRRRIRNHSCFSNYSHAYAKARRAPHLYVEIAATQRQPNGGQTAPGLEAGRLGEVKRSADRSDDPLVIQRSFSLPPRCMDNTSRNQGYHGSHNQRDNCFVGTYRKGAARKVDTGFSNGWVLPTLVGFTV